MTPPAPGLADHALRSVRAWLHGMFPGLDIHLQRRRSPQSAPRPAIRLEVASGPTVEAEASGWNRMRLSVDVAYAAAVGQSSQNEALAAADRIVSAAAPPGRIPLSLYNLPWPAPSSAELAGAAGGALPPALDVAVAGGGPAGWSDPEAPVGLAVPAGAQVRVVPADWPPGAPLASSWRLYAAEAGGALRLQAEWARGDEPPALAALVGGAAPPAQARLPLGGLRADSSDASLTELATVEGAFDAVVTLRLSAAVPKVLGDAQLAEAMAP